MDIWIISAILIITLYLLISEKLPVDLTAIGIMVALMMTGILEPVEAVSGFSNPAVLTVGAMFLISQAMIRTGAVGFIGKKVMDWTGGKARVELALAEVTLAQSEATLGVDKSPFFFTPPSGWQVQVSPPGGLGRVVHVLHH